jgi:hypothetical protein
MPTGTLVVSSGVSSINGTDLARNGEPQPFEAATNFIANNGFGDGDFVSVAGSNGNIGNVPVIFITAISAAQQDEVMAETAAGRRRRGSKKGGKRRAAKKSIKKAAKKSSKKSPKKTAKKKTTKKSTKKSAKKSAKKR